MKSEFGSFFSCVTWKPKMCCGYFYMMPLFQSPVVIEFVKKVTFSFMLARTEWHCLHYLSAAFFNSLHFHYFIVKSSLHSLSSPHCALCTLNAIFFKVENIKWFAVFFFFLWRLLRSSSSYVNKRRTEWRDVESVTLFHLFAWHVFHISV